ncbi:hypothetical protein [Chitinophaga alhagiae]|uniref:hypothetical protein n=1 Tax=Chitinophaga alhagiae TaxID=2203219 RepID=UPI0013009657|nr:hypothetical protein [Chitinophaga alhagiae]
MKRFLILVSLIAAGAVFNPASAQVRVSINIGLQPAWGPAGYDYVEYYYLPAMDMYYYVPARQYIYFDHGRWIRTAYVPVRYRHVDFYRTYKVVINDRDPFRYHDRYRVQYAKYRHVHYNRPLLRDTRYSNNRPAERRNNNWNNGRDNDRRNNSWNNGRGNERRNENWNNNRSAERRNDNWNNNRATERRNDNWNNNRATERRNDNRNNNRATERRNNSWNNNNRGNSNRVNDNRGQNRRQQDVNYKQDRLFGKNGKS